MVKKNSSASAPLLWTRRRITAALAAVDAMLASDIPAVARQDLDGARGNLLELSRRTIA